MYYVNKLVGFLTNPYCVGMALALAGLCLWRFRRLALVLLTCAFVWFLAWSLPVTVNCLGLSLEREWLNADGRVPTAEEMPKADLIVLLSGGMCANLKASPTAEICSGGDRAWHAARLYRAGKAPTVVLTGSESRESTVPFLKDLGVPEDAMLVDNDSMNTEENALFTVRLLRERYAAKGLDLKAARPKVLLVTSAYHMRRSVLMFEKYAPELDVVPAAADFEVLAIAWAGIKPSHFLPEAGALSRNAILVKELVGYWGYRLLRR